MRDRIVGLRRVPAAELLPNPRNWRKHPAPQRRALAAQLERLGYADALIAREVNGRLELIDGHLRAELSPEAEVPVLVVDLDEAEALELLASLDPLAAMAGTDREALASLLSEASFGDEALRAYLSAQAGLASTPARLAPDEAPPRPTEPESRPGALWRLGPHRLLCGDATDPEAWARLFPAGAAPARLVFTDPPYGVAYVGKTPAALAIENDRLGPEGTGALVAAALSLAAGACAPGAAFYVCSPAGDMSLPFRLALAEAALRLRQVIVWVKDVFVLGRQDYHWRHEDILYGWLEGAAHPWFGGRSQATVWEVPRPKASREHPTMKPVELAARAIRNSAAPGALVLDPFLGSGTTLVAAEQEGRTFAGMEIDPAYADVAVRRWEEFTGEEARLDG